MSEPRPIQQGRVYPAVVFYTGTQGELVLHESDSEHVQRPLTFRFNNGNFRTNAEAAVRQWLISIGIKPGCIQTIEVSDADVRSDGRKAYCRVVLKSGGAGKMGTPGMNATFMKKKPGVYRTPLAEFAKEVGETFGGWLRNFSNDARGKMSRG